MGPYVAVGNQYLKLAHDNIWGCNFAIRKDIIKKIGFFDEELGMRRDYPKLLAEDVEFVDRAVRNGFAVQFNSHAIIQHRLDSNRINFANFKKRAWQEGQTFKNLSKKGEAYSNTSFLKIMLFKAFRGCFFVFKRKSKPTALPVHMVLLVYELMGWLGVCPQ
jgi:GT2 family glycosyltransferase